MLCRVQLNANKTEAIWIGSRSNLGKLINVHQTVQVGSSRIQPSNVVLDLGVHLGNELSMKQNLAKMAATCYYDPGRISQIRRPVEI